MQRSADSHTIEIHTLDEESMQSNAEVRRMVVEHMQNMSDQEYRFRIVFFGLMITYFF